MMALGLEAFRAPQKQRQLYRVICCHTLGQDGNPKIIFLFCPYPLQTKYTQSNRSNLTCVANGLIRIPRYRI